MPRTKAGPIPETTAQRMVRMRREGATIRDLTKEFHMGHDRIYGILDAMGVPRWSGGQRLDPNDDALAAEMVSDYHAGIDSPDLQIKYGKSRHWIQARLHASGIVKIRRAKHNKTPLWERLGHHKCPGCGAILERCESWIRDLELGDGVCGWCELKRLREQAEQQSRLGTRLVVRNPAFLR